MLDFLFYLVLVLFVFALGAAIGSFLNVVIYRIPAGQSLLWPPSRCPVCSHPLSRSDNVPVLGWLWLKGRCRYCRTPISPRYPIIEAITGLLFVLIYWQFEITRGNLFSVETLGLWIFASWLLALSLIDVDTMTLPNVLTKSGLVAGFGFQALVGMTQGEVAEHLMMAVVGAVVGIWLLDIVALVASLALGKPAMGGGDAKLAAMMGAWLGWQSLLLAAFIACFIGAFGGGAAIALRLHQLGKPMPFGPFLALGAFIAALWGKVLLSLYFQLFFPTIGFNF